ncbi:hypothetical protein PENCOP_c009G00313 [Penicillium coprophilum]|uniref:Uncharacterized protein n=1 Tax=Penicillium coprophilum TaxID=36646 RepID=A0A1V6UH72_9EURO|nr:hypothetical protein PENCOP_c009G00313 [Penicillium coprophilum]
MSSFTPTQKTLLSDDINIPGIFFQDVEGFLLTDIASYGSKDSWHRICVDAIRVVDVVDDNGILNEDVKARDFILKTRPENQFHVFMINFALCKFREEYQNETEWEECKATSDEERALGYVMQKELQGGFVYHQSARYNNLDEKYQMDG